jgi:hypothetical protein
MASRITPLISRDTSRHKLLDLVDDSFFLKKMDDYASGPQGRDDFEKGLSRLLIQTNLDFEFDNIAGP